MPQYRFKAQDRSQRVIRGRSEAESPKSLAGTLLAQGLTPIAIEGVKYRTRRTRLSLRDAQEFSSVLSLLVTSGHTLSDALKIAGEGSTNVRISRACGLWKLELDRGLSFRDALENDEILLPPGFKSLLGIGDAVGALESVLTHLENYFGRLAKLRDRLGSAMVYPIIVLAVTVAAGAFIGIYVMPRMTDLMSVLNPESAAADGGSSGIGLTAFIIVLTLAAVTAFSPAGTRIGRIRSRIVLRLPGVRSFAINRDFLSWCFAIEVMVSGGIPMRAALEEAAPTVRNTMLRLDLAQVATDLERGESLASVLASYPAVPRIVVSWISIGEMTGRDKEVFGPLRRYFEDRVVRSIDLATQLAEPMFIMILGVGIVYFVARYLLPFFRMLGELV